MRGSGHFLFDTEINKALYTLKKDKDHNVLEHIEDLSVVWNTDLFDKMENDENNNKSNDLLEETKINTTISSNNNTEENLLDFADDNNTQKPNTNSEEISDLIFSSKASENINDEELINFDKQNKEPTTTSKNLLDIPEETIHQTEENTLNEANSTNISDSKTVLTPSSIDQVYSNNEEEQTTKSSNDLLDLGDIEQEPKTDQ